MYQSTLKIHIPQLPDFYILEIREQLFHSLLVNIST